MSKRMPTMSPSSGAKRRRLSKFERTTEGTTLSDVQGDLGGAGRAHGIEEIENAAVDEGQERFRIETEHQHDDDQRHQRGHFARVDLGKPSAERLEIVAVPPLVSEFTEKHALHRPEMVGGGDDD